MEIETESPVAERRYVTIAVVLGALIVAQLALFLGRDIGLRRDVALYGVLAAAAVQAVVAASMFMHLRTGHSFYRQLFVSGVVLAVLVFLAAFLILAVARPSI